MYALVLIDFYPHKPAPPLEWQESLGNLEGIEMPSSGVQKIFGSAWLIDLNGSLSFLNKLQEIARDNGLPCRVAFFEKEPTFAT